MLWRDAYRTRGLDVRSLPSIAGITLAGAPASLLASGVILGGFDVRVQVEQAIWLRLLREAFGETFPVQRWLVKPNWTPKEQRDLRATFPPSEHELTVIGTDPELKWQALIPTDRPERGFSILMERGAVKLGMLGPSTEESWDVFREAAAAIRLADA